MILYNISDKFCNDDIVNYPFNIMNKHGEPIRDFWKVINTVVNHIVDDDTSKVRFIWIEAESYCQTEVFLKRILELHHEDYPTLYLHWIDFANQGISISTKVNQVMIDHVYFSNIPTLKICVIDHAETIGQISQFTELCDRFSNNPCIFIFLSKKGSDADANYWSDLVRNSQNVTTQNLGIIRSESNYFVVKPYSIEICKELLNKAIRNDEIKRRILEIAERTLNYEMCRPYYFDLLISVLRQCITKEDVPTAFNDTLLLENIYSTAISGIIGHLKGESTLEAYIIGYYNSDFVKKSGLDEQKRLPIDNYAWAYGIISHTPNIAKREYYKDSINLIFEKRGNNFEQSSFDQLKDINAHLVKLSFDGSNTVNPSFNLKEYFIELVQNSLYGALICSAVMNDCFYQIEESARQRLFIVLAQNYLKKLGDKDKIRIHVLLGQELGKLLPKLPNQTIVDGMGYFFCQVTNDYIMPVCNQNGISVIPVTNFEFEKFVKDGGYYNYYKKEFSGPLNKIAVAYYKEIFDFIVLALSGQDGEDCSCLATLLKGYDWLQYKQIAYLFTHGSDTAFNTIYESIQSNLYPTLLEYPAKWTDKKNSHPARPFCNPLQPVTCINLFEARAYVKWLSKKIGQPVRILKFDPDYLSIVGSTESPESRKHREKFLTYIQEASFFINSAEHSKYFYGRDDIEVKEISPVAIPDTKFDGLYDFVGNVFEMQDSRYNYCYAEEDISSQSIGEFEKRDTAIVDYNCPGGGFQRNKANWPPEYMGQVPAFLRNQDIGFRIVINGKNGGDRTINKLPPTLSKYSEKVEEVFQIPEITNWSSRLLDSITITSENKELNKGLTYSYEDKSVTLYSIKSDNEGLEYIMLLAEREYIYAYHLRCITSICSEKIDNEISIITSHAIPPESLANRKKCSNKNMANWIDLLQVVGDHLAAYFEAYSLDICNGYFSVPPIDLHPNIVNKRENKKESALNGRYKISYSESASDFRLEFFHSLKSKLGANYFLPDWVNIVDFIEFLTTLIDRNARLDIETIFTAITTIDTADLHEQINKKKLRSMEERVENG